MDREEIIRQLRDYQVRWPGEGMLRTIKENRELGVPVVEEIWESVLKM